MKWILRDIRSPHSAMHSLCHAHILIRSYTHTHTQTHSHPTVNIYNVRCFSSPKMHWRFKLNARRCIQAVLVMFVMCVICVYGCTHKKEGRKPIWIGNWPVLKLMCCVAAFAMRCFYQEHTVYKALCMDFRAVCERWKINCIYIYIYTYSKNRNVYDCACCANGREIEWMKKKWHLIEKRTEKTGP